MVATLSKSRMFLEVNQKTKKFFLTQMTPEEIDSICTSPSIESRADIDNVAKFQRTLNKNRLSNITAFWDDPESNLVDNIVIIVKDKSHKGCIDFPAPHYLKFNFKGTEFAELLDGQHRIEGTVRSKIFKSTPVPVTILLESKFKPKQLGMIFTKLNSEAKPIDEFTEMILQHRYEIKPWNTPEAKSAYLTMRDFSKDPSCAIHDRIKLLSTESKRLYSGKNIALTLKKMWDTGSMPQKPSQRVEMTKQFGFYLESTLDDPDGIWADEFKDLTSSLSSSDGFCDIFMQLYPTFYEIVKLSTASKPTLADWQKVMKNLKDKSHHITDILQWKPYKNFIDSRQQRWIFRTVSELLDYTLSPSGDPVFDFQNKLKPHKTVNDYLDSHIGDFTIEFIENGKPVAAPTKIDFGIRFTQSDLTDKKGKLNIYKKAGAKWEHIYVNGQYSCDTVHEVSSGMINLHIKEKIKTGETYKFSITQTTPTNTSKEVVKVVTL